MTDISTKRAFISYVKEDAARVDDLCKALDVAGIAYWRDRKDLGPGDEWKRKIREAIQSGSMVFLACFSNHSRSRSKSVMNEELTLAVDEFRARPPGAVWLMPIRFDDGDIPEWDLGAGRTLSDLQYTDLFGDEYAVETIRLITAINRVIGLPSADSASTRASLLEANGAQRVKLMQRLIKEMVPDPRRRIELDDLISAEVQRLVATLSDASAVTGSLSESDEHSWEVTVAERGAELWQTTAPLAAALQVAARWAEPEDLTRWSAAIKSIATAGTDLRSGMTGLLRIRAIPALILVMTAAVATVSPTRGSAVYKLLNGVLIPTQYGDAPLLTAINPWAPFDSSRNVPELLARSAVAGVTVRDYANRIDKRSGPYLTPVSEWLVTVLGPIFEDQFATSSEYEIAFERAEVMLGILSQEDSIRASESGHYSTGSHWFGRSTLSDRYARRDPVGSFLAELNRELGAWPLVNAGCFGGSVLRASAAIESYAELHAKVSRQRS